MKRRDLINLHIDIDYLSNRDLRLEDVCKLMPYLVDLI